MYFTIHQPFFVLNLGFSCLDIFTACIIYRYAAPYAGTRKGEQMVLYFSGTGNSRFVAERIAYTLDDRAVNISKYLKSEEQPRFTEPGVYVFVAPCYVSTTAKAMCDLIKEAEFPEGVRAYFVITGAAYMGASPATNKKLSEKKGFIYMGTAEVVMPQNYIIYFKTRSKEENKKIVADALPVIDRIAGIIKSSERFPAAKLFFGEAALTDLVCALYYPLFMKAKKFQATAACISCRKCVSDCPLGNISFDGSKPVWGDNCTHCMACINLCPRSAIEYGKSSAGKPRYKGPEDVSS